MLPKSHFYDDLKPGDAYFEHWRRFRAWDHRRPLGFGIALLVVIVMSLFGGETGFLVGVLSALPILIVVNAAANGVTCPRCGQLFFYSRNPDHGPAWVRGGVRSNPNPWCPHCNLPKWAPDDPDKAPADPEAQPTT